MVYKPFDEKSEGANKIIASVIKIEIMLNS